MGHMFKWVLGAVAATIVAGLIVTIYRRKRAAVPGIVKHPERLDEMLDSTDDA
jgi:hypothetical protein